jgi:hypothetical protein
MSKPIRTTRIVAKPMFYETVIFGPADAPLDPAFDSKLEAPAQDWIRWLAHRNEFKARPLEQRASDGPDGNAGSAVAGRGAIAAFEQALCRGDRRRDSGGA